MKQMCGAFVFSFTFWLRITFFFHFWAEFESVKKQNRNHRESYLLFRRDLLNKTLGCHAQQDRFFWIKSFARGGLFLFYRRYCEVRKAQVEALCGRCHPVPFEAILSRAVNKSFRENSPKETKKIRWQKRKDCFGSGAGKRANPFDVSAAPWWMAAALTEGDGPRRFSSAAGLTAASLFPDDTETDCCSSAAHLGGMNLVYIITANCHAEIARPKAPRVPVCVCVRESRTELSTPAIYPISGRGNQAMRVYKWITVEPLCITSCVIHSVIFSWRTGQPIGWRRSSRETHGDIFNLTLADGCFNYYRV